MLYQFYNADLLDISNSCNEDAIVYVDDALLLVSAETFVDAHRTLADMMPRDGGVTNWSTLHNSPLEYSKLALIDFAHHTCSKSKRSEPLQLQHVEVKPSEHTRYLGVILDQNLNWKAQLAHITEKGAKWVSQIWRMARQDWGVTPKYARRLFISVTLPRILYGADIWCHPLYGKHKDPRIWGSTKATKHLATTQCVGAVAIMGSLRTSPTDMLNAIAFLLPAELSIVKFCRNAFTRMATLPKDHPLHRPVNSRAELRVK
jgi:hypothetical protein